MSLSWPQCLAGEKLLDFLEETASLRSHKVHRLSASRLDGATMKVLAGRAPSAYVYPLVPQPPPRYALLSNLRARR